MNPSEEEIMADMDAMYIAMDKEREIEDKKNQRIFHAIEHLRGKKFLKSLFKYINDLENIGLIQIVSEPKGDYQNEGYGQIRGAWVDQSTDGYICDSYYGTATIRITKKKFIEIPYSM